LSGATTSRISRIVSCVSLHDPSLVSPLSHPARAREGAHDTPAESPPAAVQILATLPVSRYGPGVVTFEHLLSEILVGEGNGETEVLALSVEPIEDADGESTWKVVLVLPRPSGDTWDEAQVFGLKQRAHEAVVQITSDNPQWALGGVPYVAITTKDPQIEQTAPEDTAIDPDQSGRAAPGNAAAI